MDNINIDEILASQVTIEVIDERTGRLFRRTLPMNYKENYSGVILTGENLNGEQSEIVFFSEAGVAKLTDLSGKGRDRPSCGSQGMDAAQNKDDHFVS